MKKNIKALVSNVFASSVGALFYYNITKSTDQNNDLLKILIYFLIIFMGLSIVMWLIKKLQ